VAPLADAVGLVHRQCGHFPIPQARQEIGEHQPLRGDVEQLVFAAAEAVEPLAGLGRIERRVEKCRAHSRRLELIHLVLHQRDERGNHDRQALADQRRELVTKAFSGTGRQDGHRIPAVERGFHDFALQRAELVVAESLLEAAG